MKTEPGPYRDSVNYICEKCGAATTVCGTPKARAWMGTVLGGVCTPGTGCAVERPLCTCPMCGGTGAADAEAKVRCPMCGGNGRTLQLEALAARTNPPPVPNDKPAVWDLVLADMHARDAVGRARYGTPLQPHNGRDALQDAYEEALDLCVYLRQAIEERKPC